MWRVVRLRHTFNGRRGRGGGEAKYRSTGHIFPVLFGGFVEDVAARVRDRCRFVRLILPSLLSLS